MSQNAMFFRNLLIQTPFLSLKKYLSLRYLSFFAYFICKWNINEIKWSIYVIKPLRSIYRSCIRVVFSRKLYFFFSLWSNRGTQAVGSQFFCYLSSFILFVHFLFVFEIVVFLVIGFNLNQIWLFFLIIFF